MLTAGILITLCFATVVCIQALMIVTWTDRHAKVVKRLKALEKRLAKTPSSLRTKGTIQVSWQGKTRVLDAEFRPSAPPTTTLAKRRR